MAHTAGPLSCSRNTSVEPDRAAWKGSKQGRKEQKKKAFHLRQKKRQHNLLNRVISLRACITARPRSRASAVQERCRAYLYLAFSLYFSCGEKKKKRKLAQWQQRELFLWMAAVVLQSHHKSRDPPRGELASSLLSQPPFLHKT